MHVSIVASPPTSFENPPHPSSTTQDGAALRQRWIDEAGCARSATALASLLAPSLAEQGSVLIELRGTLGAGKTTFTRHLLRALGVQGRIKSPSYAVVEPHEAGGLALWHFDFYRFAEPREWEDAGFRDIFAGPGLKLVEWPDKAAGLLPPADLRLDLDIDEQDVRHALWQAGTDTGRAALACLAMAATLAEVVR